MNRLTQLLSVFLLAVTVASANANYFEQIKGDLTSAPQGTVPEFTALYFSAQWCPPCRMFTPKLVDWYKKFKAEHPNFELVFVSGDRDEASMSKYIKDDGMPWPVVAYDKRQNELFQKYASDGIPYLVLINKDGQALTAKPGNEWQSPAGTLEQIEKIVGGKP
jgi:nucleoredoxin